MRRSAVRLAGAALAASGAFAGLERRALATPRKLVLCYHRVSDRLDLASGANLTVRPSDFERQLDRIARGYAIVGLSELLARTGSSSVCALTFDDGFRDNYEIAFPVLRSRNLRAAFFVCSDYVGTGRLFWQNRLQAWMRSGNAATMTHDWPAKMRELLHGMRPAERDARLERIRRSLAAPDLEVKEAMMTADHLREMRAAGMEILPHTKTHPDLATLTRDEIIDEIEGSRAALERLLGESVPRIVAYPFGSPAAVPRRVDAIMQEMNYSAGLTVEHAFATPADSPYRIRRLAVDRDDVEQVFLMKKLARLYAGSVGGRSTPRPA